jgi:cytochrome P450
VQDQFTAILETGATPPVDFLPWLKMLPTALAPWRKWALDIRAEQRKLYFELFQGAKDRVEKGAQRNCFIDNMLKEKAGGAKNALDDEHIAYVGGVLMEGGSDTTASTLLAFLMAMVKYPRVLQRAQQVVDKVCGTERSPRFDDLEHLGYIQHCVDEVSIVLEAKVGKQFELNRHRSFVGAQLLRVASHTA